MKPLVIPIFILHQGCRHRCIFCDQYTITGNARVEREPVTPGAVQTTIRLWLQRPRKEKKQRVQVAFYGGSFTGLPQQRQRELLESVKPFIRNKEVDFIRISTRPDYIDEKIAGFLKKHSVSIVELGIQSLHQDVLDASIRGHSVLQAQEAIKLLKGKGFIVGAQLMCGLPADNCARVMATARKTAELEPDFVRIYPVLVIKGSGLEKLYRDRKYKPLSLAGAVALSCRMKAVFDKHNIRVVRLGLQSSAELAEKVVAGPYHPAFGELVIARNLFRKTRKILQSEQGRQGKYLHIAAADESAFRGPDNTNIKRLTVLGLLENVEVVFNKDQARNTVLVC